ncbi:putative dihydroorotate dehydrogenase [Neospora caninum Liverpool]|uniref:Dihydroorotate dehydrogenase (quinone), mitochondrial n=1 Tax=Neospora caninum (strain Liverpool) TaxID=572307 RepID=F0V9X5_NEOCL|nr:putative dihydroorotate dehydrogenase [Neospora caninum Liverpool]CBZ50737.1 putative dihydroorotate dehydrogenase [Neospora caninum Liverpool]CEL65349.1 TPA: dihydroorotate dehydrogenase, putative [Neospora caninum Liverpool]|eukprot:XP_003880770.1 putative dihydroorotate dehydrogenase [Neospora caninum Liverpool]
MHLPVRFALSRGTVAPASSCAARGARCEALAFSSCRWEARGAHASSACSIRGLRKTQARASLERTAKQDFAAFLSAAADGAPSRAAEVRGTTRTIALGLQVRMLSVSVHPRPDRDSRGPTCAGIPSRDVSPEEIERLVAERTARERKANRRLFALVLLLGTGVYCYSALGDVSGVLYSFYEPVTSVLFRLCSGGPLDPETAHGYAMELAKRGWLPVDYDREESAMNVDIKGLRFLSPIGLAAGFDKHAEAPAALLRMGFSFLEVGSITPQPQPGNPKPRLFRLLEDRSIINRFGFNSKGADYAQQQLERFAETRKKDPFTAQGVLGVSLGKNKTSTDAVADLREGVRKLGRFADFLIVNLSSPNTPGLRSLQSASHLAAIIDAVHEELDALDTMAAAAGTPRGAREDAAATAARSTAFYANQTGKCPLFFVKISPDLTMEEKESIAKVALDKNLDGFVVSNTTIQRPETLKDPSKTETGGLSGRALKNLSTACVSDMYKLTQGKLVIIATGGVESGRDALDKIEAGASLVELYSSMIYLGPQVARRVKNELYCALNEKGYKDVAAAVGRKHRQTPEKKLQAPTFD